MKHLGCFFKSPEGIEENDFFQQGNLLVEHLKAKHAERPSRSSRINGDDRRRN
jgi:hypothetical protein